MRRSVELLFIPPEEQASVKNLREKKVGRLRRKDHRLIVVEEGLLRVVFTGDVKEKGHEAWIGGPPTSFNAIRLSPNVRAMIDKTASPLKGDLVFHVIIGEESIKAALTHTVIDHFNEGLEIKTEKFVPPPVAS